MPNMRARLDLAFAQIRESQRRRPAANQMSTLGREPVAAATAIAAHILTSEKRLRTLPFAAPSWIVDAAVSERGFNDGKSDTVDRPSGP
jgi:hypothetical protein